MNTVRIIGGEWRRRILRFPDSEGLRPTPDRVRETVFNWLGQDLSGLSCLDLFAGSGAFGFEAASRGASRVVMVEKSLRVCQALESNARLLDGTGRLQIVRADAVEFASLPKLDGSRFDLLFLDPPYRKGWIDRLMPVIPKLLADDGWLYIECEQALESCGDWRVFRNGCAGQVFYHLMRKGASDGTR